MAAGGVTSAGTFVAALLEHQGYVTQARFLDAFKEFFEYGGGLLYLIAACGAIFSVVAFGSFRQARYLLIGPACFWFLVGPRAENVNGVVWKLGGGQARGQKAVAGEEAAKSSRQEILAKLDSKGQGPNSEIKIAQGFYLFVKPIDEFTNKMVDFMLKDEDKSDLMVASRQYGLEQIANNLPQDTELIQRYEQGFLVNCQRMINSATAAAQVMVKKKGQRAYSPDAAGSPAHEQIRTHHIEQMKKFANDQIHIRGTGFDELIESYRENGGGGNSLAAQLAKNNAQFITCGQAWQLVAEETWHRGALGIGRILNITTNGYEIDEETARIACGELTRKAVADNAQGPQGNDIGAPGKCNLRPAMALTLINKRITQPYLFNQVMMRHWNNASHRNPAPQIVLVPGGGTADLKKVGNSYISRRVASGLPGRYVTEYLFSRSQKLPDGSIQRTQWWAPAMSLNMDYGMNHAMWVSTRLHELAKLRQTVFSYALNLPYYQGVLLFIIAVIYPFFAMIVLIPGKAIAAMNLPLAWFWVKSWDIGFAAAIILDKVMFNLLPSQNIDPSLETGPWVKVEQMPTVFAEAFNYDPIGSLHNYYSILAFVMLSIPTITGYATLRARRGMLSSISDGAAEAAQASGNQAAEVFSEAAQSKRNAMLREMGGFAQKLPTMEDSASALQASQAALVNATARLAGSEDRLKLGEAVLGGKSPDGVKAVSEAAQRFNTVRAQLTEANMRLAGSIAQGFDPVVGRFSTMGMLHGAYLAAMDGGGGYELYEHDLSFSKNLIGAVNARMRVDFDTISNAQGAVLRNVTDVASSIAAGNPGSVNIPKFFSLVTAASIAKEYGSQHGDKLGHEAKDQIGWLQNFVGGQGFTSQEFSAFSHNSHPLIDRNGEFRDQDYASQGFSSGFFGNVSTSGIPSPAEARAYTDVMLPMSGSVRTVHQGSAPEIAPSQFWSSGEQLSTRIAVEEFRRHDFPTEYSQEIDAHVQSLTSTFGKESVLSYLESIGQKPADGKITVQHLVGYAQHVDDLQPQAPASWKFDESVVPYAESHPLLTIQRVADWSAARGEPISVGRTTPSQSSYQHITRPAQVFEGGKK